MALPIYYVALEAVAAYILGINSAARAETAFLQSPRVTQVVKLLPANLDPDNAETSPLTEGMNAGCQQCWDHFSRLSRPQALFSRSVNNRERLQAMQAWVLQNCA